MQRMSLQRRKVVVMAAGIAALSGAMPTLFKGHPRWAIAWVAVEAGLLAWTIVELVKLKRSERR